MKNKNLVGTENLDNKILFIRGQRVMIDADLAKLYGVTTKRLNEQVKRNKERFPRDFMFRLNKKEKSEVVANCDHLKNLKYSPNLPFVFTEHGAIMLASVLNSRIAIEASIYVVRAFVRFREILLAHKELTVKLKELELNLETHDEQIAVILEAINQLLAPPESPVKKIGFTVEERKMKYAAKQKTIEY